MNPLYCFAWVVWFANFILLSHKTPYFPKPLNPETQIHISYPTGFLPVPIFLNKSVPIQFSLSEIIHIHDTNHYRIFPNSFLKYLGSIFPIYTSFLPSTSTKMGEWFYEWNNAWFIIQETASKLCHSLVDDLYLYNWLEPTIPIQISLKNQKRREEQQKQKQRKANTRDTLYSLLASTYSGDYYTPMAYTLDTLYSFFPKEPDISEISLNVETKTEIETIISSKQYAKETYLELKSFCNDAFYVELKWENNMVWLQSNQYANTKRAIDIFSQVYHRWYFFLKNSEFEKGKRENENENSPKQRWMFKHLQQKLEGWIFVLEHFHFFVNTGFPKFFLNICQRRSVFSVFSLFSFLKREMEETQQRLNDTTTYFPKEQRKRKKETEITVVRFELAKKRMDELEVRAREARTITDLLEKIQYNQTTHQIQNWIRTKVYSPLHGLVYSVINESLELIHIPFYLLGKGFQSVADYVLYSILIIGSICCVGIGCYVCVVRWVRKTPKHLSWSKREKKNKIGSHLRKIKKNRALT